MNKQAIQFVITYQLNWRPFPSISMVVLYDKSTLRDKNLQSAEIGRRAFARPIRIRHWLQKCCLLINFRFRRIFDKELRWSPKKLGWHSDSSRPPGAFWLTGRRQKLCVDDTMTATNEAGKSAKSCAATREWGMMKSVTDRWKEAVFTLQTVT